MGPAAPPALSPPHPPRGYPSLTPIPAMTLRTPLLAACATLVIGTVAGTQTSAPRTATGETYTFKRDLVHGYGISSLEDLRGKTALVMYWSHRCSPCVGYGVPGAIKLKDKYGEDLQVILAEVGGASENQLGSYALGKKWLGSEVMWTTEQPVRRESSEVPYFALLSPEGVIVDEGISTESTSKLDDAIGQLVKNTSKAPRELPRELGKAVIELNAGNYGKARAMAQKAMAAAGDDGVKLNEAKRVLDMVSARLDVRVKRIRWMLDSGYPIEAGDLLNKLEKSIKGWEEREKQMADLLDELDTPEMKLEIEAEKALKKIEHKLFADPDVRWVKNLQRIVEKYPRTKTAERAKQLAKIVSI